MQNSMHDYNDDEEEEEDDDDDDDVDINDVIHGIVSKRQLFRNGRKCPCRLISNPQVVVVVMIQQCSSSSTSQTHSSTSAHLLYVHYTTNGRIIRQNKNIKYTKDLTITHNWGSSTIGVISHTTLPERYRYAKMSYNNTPSLFGS